MVSRIGSWWVVVSRGLARLLKPPEGVTREQTGPRAAAPTEVCTTGGGTGTSLFANPGFESGATSWTSTAGVITNSTSGTPHAGSYYAWLDGYGTTHTDTVTVPSAASASLKFYLNVTTAETGSRTGPRSVTCLTTHRQFHHLSISRPMMR